MDHSHNLKNIDILLVEDNVDDKEFVLRTINEFNLAQEVKVVPDGVQALDYMFGTGKYKNRNNHKLPNLILLDLKLPKINGIQVLERIKSDQRMRVIPVVILTSSREEPDIKKCYQLGANSYIVKPVDFDKFREVIKLLGRYWQQLNEYYI